MNVNKFNEKLNKVAGKIYVVEEKVSLTNGTYEAFLLHDNINESTFAIYTGSKLTGNRITTWALSTPSGEPWKRQVRVYANEPELYITYETDGDTVEAEDINETQDAVMLTQHALNLEIIRASDSEKQLSKTIQSEILRASTQEDDITQQLILETERAKGKEIVLEKNITDENNRAKSAEREITDSVLREISRATSAEKVNADNLLKEERRAAAAEKVTADNLSIESIRAKQSEEAIQTTIDSNRGNWENKYTRAEVDNKFSTLETAIDWKEAVTTCGDLSTQYPNPTDGWTVNVKDTDYTYRFNGSAWVAISANAIPKATASVDGLLSREDKVQYDDAVVKRHTHGNKSILDKFTQAMLDAWNTVSNKVDKINGKGLSTNDYTTGEKNKLAGIATVATSGNYNDLINKPTSLPASGGNADTLDGLNSTAFAMKRSISLDELNNPNLNSGIYNIQDVSLAPVGLPNSFAHVFVGGEYTGGGFGSQIAVPYYGGQMLGVWYRTAAGANYPVFRRIDDYNNIINKPTSIPASDVPGWAKQPNKPSYSASEIGLGNVANERQYSANNPQVNISGTANSANRLNIIDGNEVVFGNGFIGGEMAVNYKGSSAPITRYVFYNGASNHGLAKIRAAEFVGNLDGTAIASTNVNGGYVYSNSIGNDYSLLQVGGGTFVTGQSNFTGYLKITLPVSWTNTMIKMEINIYDYQVQGASTYYVGGYNYNNNVRWHSTFAYSIGGSSSGRTVRFGHDGSKCCIYIGEANTVWTFPQVSINNVLTGYSGANYQTWNKNWQIGFTTSLGTITSTESGLSYVKKGCTWNDIMGV